MTFLISLSKSSKPFGGLAIIFILFASYILYLICLVVYNLCFHPLRKFPGPKSFAATPIPYAFYQITGQLPYLYSTLHKKYGSVVRVLPNEISFNNPAAWREIYGTRPGHELLTKDPKSFAPSNEGAYNIVTVSNVADHARYRNALNPAFSEKALREQEPLIITSVDLLMERLHKNCATGEPQDMVHWFNLAMFDIMAELTFGESLEGLQTSKYHPWLEGLLGSALKYVSFTRVTARFPHIARLLNLWVPKSLLEQRVKHQKFSWDMVERRLNNHPPFRDFMSYILPYDEKTATMTLAEMRATYGVMILAGSENLVATLTITLYHLLRHPDIMEKVSREVREAFPQKENITFDATNALRYLPAALTESMRIQPAAPSSQPRVVPQGGENLCGHFVPGGTIVSLPPLCMNHDENNFKNPNKFIPERWLSYSTEYNSDVKKSFQPFGVGPRSCIGRRLALAELRVVLAKLFWHFDVELIEASRGWAEGLKVYHLWDLKPFYVHLSPVERSVGNS